MCDVTAVGLTTRHVLKSLPRTLWFETSDAIPQRELQYPAMGEPDMLP
jgi:hypothetical protein